MCISAANYIINQINLKNAEKKWNVVLSSKRLQKLLYFCDVLYMTENDGVSMFKDEYYAWPSGPVLPDVYNTFMRYQDGMMHPYNETIHDLKDEKIMNVVDRVLNDTADISTNDLIEESHITDGPWKDAVEIKAGEFNGVIDKINIYEYYSKKGVPYGMR